MFLKQGLLRQALTLAVLAITVALTGCQTLPPQSAPSSSTRSQTTQPASTPPATTRPTPGEKTASDKAAVDKVPSEKPATDKATAPAYALLKPVAWSVLPLLAQEDWLASWQPWLQSCQALSQKPEWQAVCQAARGVKADDAQAIQAYWQQSFTVYSTQQADGAAQGLITGYYQPVLKGARTQTANATVPLYKAPADLINVNLSALYPELKYKRVRGRLQGQTLVPYLTRAEIEQPSAPLAGNELLWVSDAVEAFFLQVQGSGIIELDSGERVSVGYADQNGHPYQSIGKLLVERGELTASEASMQGIKQWGQQHPSQLRALLDANPSYVFFKLLPPGLSGPLGALGVPLTAARSVAVDPFYIPLGAPVYLATTYPNSNKPLQQLMHAQDTGGAIKGGVRADVYWGEGESAGKLAGAMRQSGQLWVWLPNGFPLPR